MSDLEIRNRMPSIGKRVGKLVIVGTGIKAIGQFTFEAQSHIRQADIVIYAVADPITEKWIQEQNPNVIDLYEWYDNDKNRIITYVQMAEIILSHVRKGKYVVGVFYGHPGVFVNPSQRAIEIAIQEGYEAVMLPGISAADCLYADLGVDPSSTSCQILEATDLVFRRRTLQTDAHVIIFQVGSVGDVGFNFSGFKHEKLPLLIEYLQKVYGQDYEIINYVASQYPMFTSVKERFKLSEILNPNIRKKITGISTFYIPPKDTRLLDPEMAEKLDLKNVIATEKSSSSGEFLHETAYGDIEKKAIDEIATHTTPKEYKPTRINPAMYSLIKDLALKPKLLERYLKNPEDIIDTYQCDNHILLPEEKSALLSGDIGRFYMAMKKSSGKVAEEFVKFLIQDPVFMQKYYRVLQENRDNKEGEKNLTKWLVNKGYDTTSEEIYTALKDLKQHNLSFWSARYESFVNGKRGPALIIKENTALLDDKEIENFSYNEGRLTWSDVDNDSSGSITFLITPYDMPFHKGDYIGPQFYGEYHDKGALRPGRPNYYGKINTATYEAAIDPKSSDPIDTWNNEYNTYILSGTEWLQSKRLVVNAQGNSATITYADKVIKDWEFSNNILSWKWDDGNDNSSTITFVMSEKSADKDDTTVPQFFGKIWDRKTQPPDGPNIYGLVGLTTKPEIYIQNVISSYFLNVTAIHHCACAAIATLGHFTVKSIQKLNDFIDAKINSLAQEKINLFESDWQALRENVINCDEVFQKINAEEEMFPRELIKVEKGVASPASFDVSVNVNVNNVSLLNQVNLPNQVSIPNQVTINLPTVAQNVGSLGRFVTNKWDIENSIRSGGWAVAFGRDLTEEDAAEGAVAIGVSIFSSDPAPALEWLNELVNVSLEQLEASIENVFTSAARQEAINFAMRIIQNLLQGGGHVGLQFLNLPHIYFKAGVAQFIGNNELWIPNASPEGGFWQPTGNVISYCPYVGMLFTQ